MSRPPSDKVPKHMRVSCTRDTLELCAYANDRLRDAGFERVCVSMQSEATYWKLPGRSNDLLRVAAHQYSRSPGLLRVVAKITFRGGKGSRGKLTCTDEYVENSITWAIGQYILESSVR